MRRLMFLILLFVAPTAVSAATHTLTINDAGTLITCSDHTTNGANLAVLFDGSHDTLSDGDVVNLTPNGTVEWTACAAAAAGWTIANSITLNGNGVTIAANTSTASTSGVLLPTVSNFQLKNFRIAADGTNGRAFIVGSNTSGGPITDFLISDVTVIRCAAQANYGPMEVRRNTTDHRSTSGTLRRVNMTLDAAYRDVFATAGNDTSATTRGTVYLVDCQFAYARAGSVSNNPISVDGVFDVIVFGGKFHDADGDVIGTASGVSGGMPRCYVYGAEVWNSHLASSSLTVANAGIRAQWIENCYIHDCPVGSILEESPTTDGTTMWDFLVARGNRIVAPGGGSLARTDSGAGLSDYVAAIVQRGKHALVENNLIENWNYASTGSSTKNMRGFSMGPAGDGAIAMIRNNWFRDCFIGLYAESYGGQLMQVEGNLFTASPTAGQGGVYASAQVWASGGTIGSSNNLRLRNNVFAVTPAAAITGYIINGGGYAIRQDSLSGYNYYGSNGNLTANLTSWTAASTDKSTTAASTVPTVDGMGRQLLSSTAYRWGETKPVSSDAIFGDRLVTGAVATYAHASTPKAIASYGNTPSGYVVLDAATRSVVNDFYLGLVLTCTNAAANDLAGTNARFTTDPTGTASAGGAATITLAAGSSSTNNAYTNRLIKITGGTGANQLRRITTYVGSTLVATVDSAWATPPDNTSTYIVHGAVISSYVQAFGQALVSDTWAAFPSGAGDLYQLTNGPGQCLTTFASTTADFYKHQSMYASSGGMAGHYARIFGYTTAKFAQISPMFPGTPFDADTLVLLPPMNPSGADLGRMRYAHLDLSPSALALTHDMFGRFLRPDYDGSLSAGSFGGRLPGGPFAETPTRTDFRSTAPPRGWYPGQLDALTTVRDR